MFDDGPEAVKQHTKNSYLLRSLPGALETHLHTRPDTRRSIRPKKRLSIESPMRRGGNEVGQWWLRTKIGAGPIPI
jgi:hypothetical protein